MHFTVDEATRATLELRGYLEQQVHKIVPLLKPIVRATIEVVRIGFTRNASATPYIVYKANGKRCCTFVKKIWFLQLVQVLLKVDKKIDDRIRSVVSTEWWGLKVATASVTTTIFDGYANKFFTLYNKVAMEALALNEECDCQAHSQRMYGFCYHDVAAILYSR